MKLAVFEGPRSGPRRREVESAQSVLYGTHSIVGEMDGRIRGVGKARKTSLRNDLCTGLRKIKQIFLGIGGGRELRFSVRSKVKLLAQWEWITVIEV